MDLEDTLGRESHADSGLKDWEIANLIEFTYQLVSAFGVGFAVKEASQYFLSRL